MSNQQIARERFKAYDAEMHRFIFDVWVHMTDIDARDAAEREIKERHGYQHGWFNVNGEGFCRERAFPESPYQWDQGVSD
jgi:hypothetical protein